MVWVGGSEVARGKPHVHREPGMEEGVRSGRRVVVLADRTDGGDLGAELINRA